MTSPSREQKPFYNRFIQLLEDDSFVSDIESLRSSERDITEVTYENFEELDDGTVSADEVPSLLHQMMIKYHLPIAMYDFLLHYVLKGEIELSRLRSGVYIVDHAAQEASGPSGDKHANYQSYAQDFTNGNYIELSVAIPADARSTQIVDTLSLYKEFIREKQANQSKGIVVRRIKLRPMELRNKEILRLHKQGLKPSEILFELSDEFRGELTSPDISKIVHKLKSKS